MTATATLGPATRPGPVVSRNGDNMNADNMREVSALYVEGFGPMSADEAKDALATVERLNTENRELVAKVTELEANAIATHERNHENAVTVAESFREEIERLRETNNAQRVELDRLRFADMEADDPRLAHLWEKAYRYASSAGFCAEFERIADALGIPQQEIAWTGTAYIDVTVSVPVPVSGMANRAYINDGDVEVEDVDKYAIAEALNERDWSQYDIDSWSLDSVEDVCADDA
jgi:hypothetical protein